MLNFQTESLWQMNGQRLHVFSDVTTPNLFFINSLYWANKVAVWNNDAQCAASGSAGGL